MPDFYARMIQLSGSTVSWSTSGLILRRGELGLDMDESEAKLMVGDGVSPPDQLPYILFGRGGLDSLVTAALAGKVDKVTQITLGAGLQGGGALSSNVNIAIDPTSNGWGRRYVETTTPPAGVGTDGDIWFVI